MTKAVSMPLLVVVFVTVMNGCTNQPAGPKAVDAAKKPAAPEIKIAQLQPGVIQRNIEQPGTVQPNEETQIMARLAGYVQNVHVDIGQTVKGPRRNEKGEEIEPGQLLADLSVPEIEEEYQQKLAYTRQVEAEVEQSRKALAAADAHVANAEALVDEAKASLAKTQALYDRWQSEGKRATDLVAKGVMDTQSHDEIMNQFKAAEAGRNEAKARIASTESAVRKAQADRGKAEADLKAVSAKVEVCQADARRVAATLSFAKIRAPFDGVVTSRRINTGDLLSTTGNRPAIFTVARLDPVRFVIQVPEADAGLVTDKLPVDLALQSQTVTGRIARTSWSLDTASRTLRAEADVPNADGKLRPGMYVNARIRIDIPVNWVVPASAIVKTSESAHCFLVEDGKAVKTLVQIGRSDGQKTEIVKIQRGNASSPWESPSADLRVAYPAAGVTSGQVIAVSLPKK